MMRRDLDFNFFNSDSGGRIIDNLQIDNQNLKIDYLQIDNVKLIGNLKMYNLQITLISYSKLIAIPNL